MEINTKREQLNMKFRQFLELKFLEWQRGEGGRKTVKQFAKYLGVSQQSVSSWWNETRIPQGDNVQKLANKLGLEVYDVLGLPRPDADLHYLQQAWENIPTAARRAIREQAEKYQKK